MIALASSLLARAAVAGGLSADVATATPARANTTEATAPLLLEVFINGRDTGKIAEFVQRNDTLLLQAGDLEALGLRGPKPGDDTGTLIPLTALTGLQYRVDALAQSLFITAPTDSLLTKTLAAAETGRVQAPIETGLGATLNYDLVGTRSGREDFLSGLFDLRGFSPWGIASSGVLVSPDPAAAAPNSYRPVRLDSNWTLSNPDTLRRYRVGDFITGGLAWSRPVRLGGAQFALDFSLRPDLITIPLPEISGVAAVPSTVDVLVNGTRVLSTQAQTGPFVIPQLPVISGANNVSLAITDALGRQVVTTLPFYTGGGLLAPGLQTFSVEAGLVRLGYGTVSNDYDSAAVSATWRRGLSDLFTIEAHSEATKNLLLAGGGGVLNLANLGLLNFGIAGSNSSGRGGLLLQAGIARLARPLSLNINATWAQRGYTDIAGQNSDSVPRLQVNAGAALDLGRIGSVALAYNIVDRRVANIFRAGASDAIPFPATFERARLLSGNYAIQLGSVSFYANGFRDLVSRNSGVSFGLSVPLGPRSSMNTGGVLDSGRAYGQLESSQSATEIGEFGYQLYAAEGAQSHEFAQAQYISPWARLAAGADRINGDSAFRIEAQGAVSLIDGGVFPSPPVNDAFAVVDTGGLEGVRVMRENRIVGETDAAGRIFIPDLHAFEVNHLAIDPNDVPPDISLASATQEIRPQDRTGVVVPFQIRRIPSALLRLVDEDDQPIPVGSAARLRSTGAVVPVGYDGEAYVEGVAEHDELNIEEPDGKRCTAAFTHHTLPGEIPQLGPIRCQERAP